MKTNEQKPSKKLVSPRLLFVHSIFQTIQGEGPFSGRPATFIRLAGCNLQCPFCFVGSTNITMGDGSSRKIKDVKKGDSVLSYNEKTNIFESKEVVNTMVSETHDIYRVYTGDLKTLGNGGNASDVLFCTGEHPFLVKNKGWVNAKDLTNGDVILHLSMSDRIKLFNPMYGKKVSNKVSKTLTEGYSSGRIEKHSMSEQGKQKISIRMTENNPMKDPEVAVKGYLNRKDRGKKTSAERTFEKMCEGLSIEFVGDGSLVIGNKIPDFRVVGQNKVIEVWDATAPFGKARGKEYIESRINHFKKNGVDCLCVPMYPDGNYRSIVSDYINNGETVTSVEKLEVGSKAWIQLAKGKNNPCVVYNLEVADNHTYLANGKIVHNCDTDYTSNAEEMSYFDIIKQVTRGNFTHTNKLIVITGGEPFRQDISLLTDTLIKLGFTVQIETNGSMKPNPSFTTLAVIVCSPKTKKIDEMIHERAMAFKYVVEAGNVSENDGLPIFALGNKISGIVARPHNRNVSIYVSPLDSHDKEKNRANLNQAIKSCMEFGYILSLQTHKILGME